ncbi:uncharacterized protein LOC125505695 [Dendroctonus ponderosae]|uniref:uncharacterized protein LOC125503174 n=1 Tax=Dendroctonus ponderosae TaxID=77166 RepID=UPI0020365598|nr:uncharacterized protein LOC125503174 [Dendroctonus ponderosae]XP_048525974.1 uncharacterized protein LOC125505695 [Dendroctonus ponderosae]KAH0998369.1 hypothetical protein HUJ05_010925 [Dendroctonus ponderosae]
MNKALLDDIDDLDYEPDGVEKPLEEVPTPDQNGRDLILESYHNSETQNFNFQPLVFPKSASSIQSFRDFDYKHLDVDIDQNSFRTHYNSYVSNSERSYHLDSSDDEESTVPFSNSSFQVSGKSTINVIQWLHFKTSHPKLKKCTVLKKTSI